MGFTATTGRFYWRFRKNATGSFNIGYVLSLNCGASFHAFVITRLTWYCPFHSLQSLWFWSFDSLRLVSVPNDEAKLNSVLTNSTEPGRPERPYHALVAGAVGGYFVWGRYSSVNYQIVLYLTSRVLVGLWKRHWLRNHTSTDLLPEALTKRSYAIGAATVWGLVMFLFESHPEVLHPSLKNSMDEIYR
jgi:hypothetical protein